MEEIICYNGQIYRVFNKAIKMVKDLKIPYGRIVSVEEKPRLIRTWGQCHLLPSGAFEIYVSPRLLENEDALLETLLHEIVHTCKGCFNHGVKWKKYAEKINTEYGTHLKRCTSESEKAVTPVVPKYIIKCEKCGYEYPRMKFTKMVEGDYKNCECSICGGSLKRIK